MDPRRTAAVGFAALAGCGGAGASTDEREATARLGRGGSAMATKDDAGACALLTKRLREGIDLQLRQLGNPPSRTCKTYATRWTFPRSPVGSKGARVGPVRNNGAKGNADLTAPGVLGTRVTLRKERGR